MPSSKCQMRGRLGQHLAIEMQTVDCKTIARSRPHSFGRQSQQCRAPLTRSLFKMNTTTTFNYYARITLISCLVAFALIALSVCAATPDVSSKSATSSNQTQQAAVVAPKTEVGGTTKQSSGTSQEADIKRHDKTTTLESQATDLSSMYVQIPIAEPPSEGGAQATATGGDSANEHGGESDSSGADSTKATTWTGPWPKKFQIGYIKQSDLHQVLIESLKSDPFMGTSSKAGASSGKTSAPTSKGATTQAPVAASGGAKTLSSAAPPSDASSLMAPSSGAGSGTGAAAYPQLKAVQQAAMEHLQQQQQQQNHHANNNHHHNLQQQPIRGQQPAGQYWPSMDMQSYGRLAMPQVAMPRPRTHNAAMFAPALAGNMLMQQQHVQQQQLRNARHHNHQHLSGNNQQHHSNQPHPHTHMTNSYRQQASFNQHNRAPSTSNEQRYLAQQQPKLVTMTSSYPVQQQPQSFQFANFPSSAMKNQPIYTTINNFPSQQQQGIDADNLQLVQMAGLGNGQQQVGYGPAAGHLNQMRAPQAPKQSDYVSSSWRPVTSQEEAEGKAQVLSGGQQQQQQLNPADFLNMNDGFDDTFNMPAKDAQAQTADGASDSTMNRHPALSNYLGREQQKSAQNSSVASKASPVKVLKQQQTTKTRFNSGAATKGGREDDRQQLMTLDEGIKSATGRRALPASGGNSTSSGMNVQGTTSNGTITTSTTQAPNSQDNSTSSLFVGQENVDSSTASSVTTTTTTLASTDLSGSTVSNSNNNSTSQVTTTTQASEDEATTSEPDSEVIDSEGATTEPTIDSSQEATTMASAVAAASGSGSSTTASSSQSASRSGSTTPASDSTGNGGESEVVATQAPSGSAATFPAVQSEEASSSSGNGEQSTTTASSREETTPTSLGAPSSSTAAGTSNGETSTTSSSSSEGQVEVKGSEVEGSNVSQMASNLRNGRTDATMSDEALLAAAARGASDLNKSNKTTGSGSSKPMSQRGISTTSTKKARSNGSGNGNSANSSERLVQASQQRQQALEPSTVAPQVARANTKTTTITGNNNKLITKRPQQASAGTSSRVAKQINTSGTKSSSASLKAASLQITRSSPSSNRLAVAKNKKQKLTSQEQRVASGNGTKPLSKSTNGKALIKNKITRMAPAAERLVQANQVVSMTAAQAQSTAQTLASLLLARCLSSTNCAHLLDVCTTKQAAVPLQQQSSDGSSSDSSSSSSSNGTNVASAAWSVPVGLMSNNLMSLMQALQADKALRLFPAWRDALENIVDQDSQTGYTLIMPSNEAIERLPPSQVDALLANGEQMSQLIDNHILDASETLPTSSSSQSAAASQQANNSGDSQTRSLAGSRYLRSKRLQVNQHRDRMVTLNGKRVVYANQLAPGGGRIHVIDGLLDWPTTSTAGQATRPLDIMDTLKQCDKFDGFVTLAEGTGLAQILKQDEPLTVFVPSNEALRKIPDEELEVIKNNSTALREFIMYHIVNGSYFSQDLRDGQQLSSILDMKPIQVGVRVDGCSRRLVEANTSPMRRPDIVAKNGVIHILDWYLTARDNEWCEPIGRAQGSLTASSGNSLASSPQQQPPASSERLQQLASEPMVLVSSSTSTSITSSSSSSSNVSSSAPAQTGGAYATRMSTPALPANHKASAQAQQQPDELELAPQASNLKPTSTLKRLSGGSSEQQLQSIYVSVVPTNEVVAMP